MPQSSPTRIAQRRDERLRQAARRQGFVLRKGRKDWGRPGRWLILNARTLRPATPVWLVTAEVVAFLDTKESRRAH